MKKNSAFKLITLLLAVLFAVSVLGGCQSTDEPDGTDSTQEEPVVGDTGISQGTTAEADGKFTLRYTDAETLNPIKCENIYNDAVTGFIYEGLFRLDSNFRPINVLCSDYSTQDGKSYTFNIIEAKMHDGSDLTAEDVMYSINRARNSSKYGARLRNIYYCGVNENGSIVMELHSADYSLPALLDIPIIKAESIESECPPGTGPYYFNSIGGYAGLSPFKDYRAKENITLDRIYLEKIADTEVEERFANYKLDCIWADTAGENPVHLYSDHEARYYDTAILQYVGFNSETPVLRDPNMRLAVSYAVNREMIVDDIYDGKGQEANLILNPSYYLYSESWEEGFGYSAAKVSECLAASGLDDKNSDGYLEYPVNGEHQYFELTFLIYDGNEKKVKAAESIVENLKNVGIKVILVAKPWDEYILALSTGEFDLYYAEVSLTRNFDFCSLMEPGGYLDYGGMGNAEYSILCRAFLNAPTEEERAEAAKNLCINTAAAAPIVPVMYRQYVVYTHRGVLSNFMPTVSGVFSNVSEWTVRTDDE